MQKPCKGHPSVNVQKGKNMVGKHDPADHQPDHGKEHQQIDDSLKHTEGRRFPAKQALIPACVEDVMKDKQQEHHCSGPLVRHIAPELITHQEKQSQRHQHIYPNLEDRFRLHAPSSCHPFSPGPSSHSVIRLCASDSSLSVRSRPSRISAPAALSSIPERLLPKPPLALVLKGIKVFPVQS